MLSDAKPVYSPSVASNEGPLRLTWVHEQIFAAGGTHIPEHWAEFIEQYGPTSVLHLEPRLPMRFVGPAPRHLLWLALDHEEQADLATRELAARFISRVLEQGGQVLLHCRAGRHRARWALVAYQIWSGKSVKSATRLAGENPWLGPYQTDQSLWEQFAAMRAEAEPGIADRMRSEG